MNLVQFNTRFVKSTTSKHKIRGKMDLILKIGVATDF